MCIAAWITAKYNAHHNFPNSGLRARVRYILFVSIWTVLFGSVYLALFIAMAGSWITGIASHLVLYVSYCSPLIQNHHTHPLFQFVCNLGILVSGSGSAHSIPRRSAWLPYPNRVCILRAPQCFVRFCMAHLVCFFFFSLYHLSHKQVDNCLQGSVDFRVSFRNHPSHYGCKTRRRGCWPHGWSLSEGQEIEKGAKVNTKVGEQFVWILLLF